jgi:hypothetical protein
MDRICAVQFKCAITWVGLRNQNLSIRRSRASQLAAELLGLLQREGFAWLSKLTNPVAD